MYKIEEIRPLIKLFNNYRLENKILKSIIVKSC
nr:MAG TPA: hypothetical protein [Bacteriophage sp.]